MTPEAKVKKKVKEILTSAGEGCWFYMPAANGYGRAGIPDFIGCYRGRFFAVECKAGKGTLTALQEREMTNIFEAGGAWWEVNDRNIEDFKKTFLSWCASAFGAIND